MERGLQFNKIRALKTSRASTYSENSDQNQDDISETELKMNYLNQGQNLSLISENEHSQEELESKGENSNLSPN